MTIVGVRGYLLPWPMASAGLSSSIFDLTVYPDSISPAARPRDALPLGGGFRAQIVYTLGISPINRTVSIRPVIRHKFFKHVQWKFKSHDVDHLSCDGSTSSMVTG